MAKDPYDQEEEGASDQDAIRLAVKQEIFKIGTQALGRISSYDHTSQRATVQLTVRAVLNGEAVKIPPITGVPVLFPSGDGFAMTWPLKAGDEGIVMFLDRSMDEWNQTGRGDIAPQDLRRFDITDAVFLPSVRPLPSPLQSAHTDAAWFGQEVATNGNTGPRGVKVTKDGKVLIGDEQGNDLVQLVDDLAEALLTSTHGSVPLDPVGAGKIAALRVKLASLLG